jgi:hypothetical protein
VLFGHAAKAAAGKANPAIKANANESTNIFFILNLVLILTYSDIQF